MRSRAPLAVLLASAALLSAHAADQSPSVRDSAKTSVSYAAKAGPGQGRHVVFLAGDEEYRSEEALPMLAKILSQRHGFKSTVLFSVDPDGTINPKNGKSLSDPAALDTADAIVMSLRFRAWPDEDMARFDKLLRAGKPIVALRTSTHAFNGLAKGGPWETWNYDNKGGFGKRVLGETWLTHWGKHKIEATRGVIEPSQQTNPLLRGVTNLFGDTDVYEAYPPADAAILVRGLVLSTLSADAAPADYRKRRSTDKQEQGVNDPPMPVVWTRTYTNDAGTTNRILTTTLGSATDLENEGLRRLIVNGVYWGLGLDVPAKADVTYVDEYKPSFYGFDGFRKGLRASDFELGKKVPGEPLPRPALSLLPAPSAAQRPPVKVILDTDIGTDIDDAWALGLVMVSPEFDLVAVTISDGDTKARSRVACKLLHVVGRGTVPVAVGRATPPPAGVDYQFTWADDFTAKQPVAQTAAQIIVETARRSPGEVTLMAVGPLQNVADALRLEPNLPKLLKRVVLMSGSIGPSAISPVALAEWNVLRAIADAQLVYSAGFSLTIVPLDSTTYVQLRDAERERLRTHRSPLTQSLEALYRLWLNSPTQRMTLHDQLAIAETARPGEFFGRCETLKIRVTDQGFTRIDPAGRDTTVCLEPKRDAFMTYYLDGLTK